MSILGFINGLETRIVIVTGVNYSIISETLAEHLNLPINTTEKEDITIADNTSIITEGICSNFFITFNNNTYQADATVIKNASQDLLLGIDWLHKNKIIINMETQEITIPHDNYNNNIRFQCKKYINNTVRQYKITKEILTCYSTNTIKLKPGKTETIDIYHKSENNTISSNGIVYVHDYEKNELHITPGATNNLNTFNNILITNKTNDKIIIEKGQKIALASIIKKAKIADINQTQNKYELQDFIKCYKGQNQNYYSFKTMIQAIISKDIKRNILKEFHEINATENTNAIRAKPYRLAIKEKEEVKNKIKEMLESDVIRPSFSKYSTPIVLVTKSDGSYRFCVYYQTLNKYTIRDNFPIPRISEALDELTKATIFSNIDLRSGYWQVPMKEQDKEKTAFVSHEGLFEFNVMPFGLCNAPATF